MNIVKTYQFYALKHSNPTHFSQIKKYDFRNLVREIRFENSGSRNPVPKSEKNNGFLQPLFFPSQELEKYLIPSPTSESRLQIKSPIAWPNPEAKSDTVCVQTARACGSSCVRASKCQYSVISFAMCLFFIIFIYDPS